MGDPTLNLTSSPMTLSLAAGLVLSLSSAPTTLNLTQGGQALSLPVTQTSLSLQSGPTLTLPLTVTSLQFSSAGVQGPPGPAQIYDQAAVPPAIPGYVLLLFQPAGTSDPNDRLISLIE